MPPNKLQRGDLVWVELDPVVGSEIAKTRPCLILQNDILNEYSPVTTVTPLTSQPPKRFNPYLVAAPRAETGLHKDSWVTCTQVRTVSTGRIRGKVGKVSQTLMYQVDEAVQKALGFIPVED